MSKNIFNFLLKSDFKLKEALLNYKFYDKIAESGLFDEEFYLKTYGDITGDALTDYLFQGYRESKYPSKYFDSVLYSKTYNIPINPLLHYVAYGKDEGKIFQRIFPLRRKEEITKTNLSFLENYEFEKEPLISIIILNRDGYSHLKRLFNNFKQKTNYSNYEIIVVDNDSTDNSVEYLKALDLPIRIVENTENVSFSKGNNQGAKIANGEYLLLLNNDIEVTYGWLNELVGTIVYNDDVAAVGSKLVFPFYKDNLDKSFKIQHCGDIFAERMKPCCAYGINNSSKDLDIFDSTLTQNRQCIAVTAAAMLVSSDVYHELGGLDEDYKYGLEDVDFCLKLHKNGYKTMLSANTLLFHHESSTRIKDDSYFENDRKNTETFTKKWRKYLSKNMLIDKIRANKFFTEKDLKITIIADNKNDFIGKIANDFKKYGYTVELIDNFKNYYIGNSSDILISFSEDYNIGEIIARKDIVKIFVLKSDSDINKLADYDILVTNDENIEVENSVLIKDDFSSELMQLLVTGEIHEF